jgi:hypothetical protein
MLTGIMKRSVLGLLVASSGCLLVAACGLLPDPKGDYDDFVGKTEGARVVKDAGAAPDVKPPTEPIKALYVGTCITVLSNKSPKTVLRFYTDASFVPNEGAGGGKLSLNMQPMRGWTNQPPPGEATPPKSISKNEAVGAPIVIKETDVAASGVFKAPMGVTNVDGDANGISGRPITLDPTLEGTFGVGDKFCAGLSGSVTSPVTVGLEPTDNVCLFKKVAEGDPVPEYVLADFDCSKQ